MALRSRRARPLAIVLLLAACTRDDATPGPTTDPPAATTVPATTTTVRPTTSTSTTTTSTTTTSTTSTTTTTIPVPGVEVVASTCEVLRTAGWWPERRAAIMANTAGYEGAGGTGPLVDPVRAACPDDLARAETTMALDDRLRSAERELAAARADPGGFIDLVSCVDGVVDVVIKNPSSEPIGYLAGAGGGDGADDQALIRWSVPAGTIDSLRFANVDRCSASVVYFAADASAVDASLPGAGDPAATGDDPAVWLPTLVAAPGDSATDVRALRDREAPPLPPDDDPHPIVSATVCPGTVDQLDADHVAFAYRVQFGPHTVDLGDGPVDHPAYSVLEYDAFRRGADGQWRTLVGGQPLSGAQTAADCGPVVPHP